jgi:glycosyltransferase involved in cell wall biosynthesis
MRVSHVICSRNRAAQLKITLSKIEIPEALSQSIELVLVDSASDDATAAIMEAWAKGVQISTKLIRTDRPGLAVARNYGVRAAAGDLMVFTDDDCYLQTDFYAALFRDFKPDQHQYGMGQSLLFDFSDDPRIAVRPIDKP